MKRRTILKTPVVLATGALLGGCDAPAPPPAAPAPSTPSASSVSASCALLAYFSRAGENYYYGDTRVLEIGNTEVVAGMISAAITVEAYDTVLLGSGIWNVRPPMIMRTFVESVDLSGKTILPFVTYAVSGLGRTIEDYTRLCPRSTIGQGLAVRGEEAQDAQAQVQTWLRTTKLLPT